MVLIALLIAAAVVSFAAIRSPRWFWATFASAPTALTIIGPLILLDPDHILLGPLQLRVWDPSAFGLLIGILYHFRGQGLRPLLREPGGMILRLVCGFLLLKVLMAVLFRDSTAANVVANSLAGGSIAALGEIRDSFLAVFAPIYAILTVRKQTARYMGMPALFTVGIILLRAVTQIATTGTVWDSSAEFRFINANEAVTLTILSLLLFFLSVNTSRSRAVFRSFACVGVVVALVANHRSEWVAAAAGFAVLSVLILSGKLTIGRRGLAAPICIALLASLLIVAGVTAFSTVDNQLLAGSTGMQKRMLAVIDPSQDANASWRQDLWRDRIAQVGDNWLWGRQLGDRQLSYAGNYWTTVPNHNAYVTAFELGGLTMLTLMVLFFGTLARAAMQLLRMKNSTSWQPALALGIIAMCLGFGVAYDFPTIGPAIATLLVLRDPRRLVRGRDGRALTVHLSPNTKHLQRPVYVPDLAPSRSV